MPATTDRSHRRFRRFGSARRAAVCAVAALVAGGLFAAAPPAPENDQVTPPVGTSWLTRLDRSVDATALGRGGLTGTTPAAAREAERQQSLTDVVEHGFTVTGADLFRLSCRACHGAAGAGVPPEIRPLTVLVRATSAGAQEQQMKSQGEVVDRGVAEHLAELARGALMHRLEAGGTLMPKFDHLGPQERQLLVGYLDKLAGVAPTEPGKPTLHLSVFEVGEDLVKGTCQTCHDAGEAAPGRAGADRTIPPLSRFPRNYGMLGFVEKARHGTPVALGRGRMPQFPYLRDEELEAAYLYLTAYPPK